jgi:transposase
VLQKGLDQFERIGEDVNETVERRPASMVVLAIHKGKFIERGRSPEVAPVIRQAPTPELPIPGGMAGPALLADTIVKRWEDHLPLHRLERVYGRDGLELPRSTVCNWHSDLSRLVTPLILAMWDDALKSPYLCTDATGVLVQEEKKCRRGHFFVVAAPGRHVLFGYTADQNAKAVDKLLRGYKGYLVADAHTIYDHLYRSGDVVECGCWAHTRRYFFKSLETDPERSKIALGLMGELFDLERLHSTAPPERRLAERQRTSTRVVATFFAWCEVESARVLDETPISKAIQYARNQEEALRRFLEDGPERARTPARSRRPEELALPRFRRRRRGQCHVRHADRELSPPRHRSRGVPPRSLLSHSGLEGEPGPRAGTSELESDVPA